MVAGTSARESVKEMKRLKNEPLLLLVCLLYTSDAADD